MFHFSDKGDSIFFIPDGTYKDFFAQCFFYKKLLKITFFFILGKFHDLRPGCGCREFFFLFKWGRVFNLSYSWGPGFYDFLAATIIDCAALHLVHGAVRPALLS